MTNQGDPICKYNCIKVDAGIKKQIEQRPESGTRVTQMKKVSKKIVSGSSDQHKHDDYNIDQSQNSQSNSEADPDKIEDLNIGSN